MTADYWVAPPPRVWSRSSRCRVPPERRTRQAQDELAWCATRSREQMRSA